MTSFSLHKCAICHQSLGDVDKIIMTLDFFAPTDPLAEYADVTMHENCFMDWSKRDEFLLPDDVVPEHNRTPDGLEIIRLLRKRTPVSIWEYHMNDTDRLQKEREQEVLFAQNEFVYLGQGPYATGEGPGWRISESLYLKCVLCGYMMVLDACKDDGCFCGALNKDKYAGRLGSTLGDKGIEVYQACPKATAAESRSKESA